MQRLVFSLVLAVASSVGAASAATGAPVAAEAAPTGKVSVDAGAPRVATGRVERLADFPSKHVPPRNVDVWLPAGYDGKRRHDVLYMHDGQMLFDATDTWNHKEWRADEVAGELIAAGRTRPFIIVGIWNAGDARHQEYFPQKPFESLAPAQREEQYALEMGPGRKLFAGPIYADRYLRFMVEELKPWIDSHYAVARSRKHTFTLGSSMGALISLYALAEYPEVFGGAACMSTHWPGSFAPERNPLPAVFFDYIGKKFPRAGRHRIYFDHGTESLDAHYAALQKRVDALIAAKGYTEADWQTRVFPGDEHSEVAWAARLAVPLQFLFGGD